MRKEMAGVVAHSFLSFLPSLFFDGRCGGPVGGGFFSSFRNLVRDPEDALSFSSPFLLCLGKRNLLLPA